MEEKAHGKNNPYTFEEKMNHAKKLAKIDYRFKKLKIKHYTAEVLEATKGTGCTVDAIHIRHFMNGKVLNFVLCDLIEKRLYQLEIIQSDYKQVKNKM